MDLIQLPYGNGQEIYIDTEELYIKNEWVNQKLHAIIMPEIPLKKSNPVYEAYKETFKYLYKMNYKIVTDSRLVNTDTFFFTPCLDVYINKTKEEYTRKKHNKIDFFLQNEGIKEPFTLTFPSDFFPTSLPSLPFILKNKDSHGGKEKFLIKNEEQLGILKKFYNEIEFYSKEKIKAEVKKEWRFLKGLDFDENGNPNMPGPSICFINYKKEFHENMIIQKYIKTPTKYNTSLRVLTSSSGDIFVASLKYSDINNDKTNIEEKYYGIFDKYLCDSSSPYFLNCEKIVSNTVSGGNSILLGKDSYSKIEQEILLAHGISPINAEVPQNIENACINVATGCSHEIGAICGLDFIYDEEKREWKYLEEHEYPMLYSYAEKYNLSYDSSADDFFTTNKLLDLQIRLHALMLTVQKKQSFENERHVK